MENIILKAFEAIFRFIAILLIAGTFLSVLSDLQKKALESQHVGLTSMLIVNQQLVGKIK